MGAEAEDRAAAEDEEMEEEEEALLLLTAPLAWNSLALPLALPPLPLPALDGASESSPKRGE